MEPEKPHWFISFARQTNLYIGITSVLFVIWFLRFGIENIKQVWLSEYFGESKAKNYALNKEIAKKISDLFTAEFYDMKEAAQTKKTELFWKNTIAPIAKNLPPDEMADTKEMLFVSIYRMNHPITERSVKFVDLISHSNTSPQEPPEQK